MLKKRIVANLVVRNGIVVQSFGFKRYLPVGKPDIAIEFLNQWGIDEIILTDISATKEGRGPDLKMIREATKKCFVPLTIGGGIKTTNDIKELMHCGADKISLNQSVLKNPSLISKAAQIFGNQCVVISIDGIRIGSSYKVFDYINREHLEMNPGKLANLAENAGAGEILINSINKDGTYSGYDIDLINQVCNQVKIPVIACGGAKNAMDMIELLNETNVSAAGAANFFHFFEHSVTITKAILSKKFVIRHGSSDLYNDNNFDQSSRLIKKNEETLEALLFKRIEKEEI